MNAQEILARRFELRAPLGAGASALVHRALDRETGEIVAVKVMRRGLLEVATPEARSAVRRFEREAGLLARLTDCPAVPRYIASRTEGEPWFIAMELVEGRTVGELLRTFPTGLVPAGFLMLAERLVEGLAAIHAQRVLHRDISPENVVVVEEGEDVGVRFLDFGIGKPLEGETDPVTRQSTIAGTPQYLSPEQTRGLELDERSDVYALGVLLYELATGSPPIRVRSVAEVARIRRERPAHLREHLSARWLPDDLTEALMRCLEKAPDARPPLSDLQRRIARHRSRPEWRQIGAEALRPWPADESSDSGLGAPGPGVRFGPYLLRERVARRAHHETWIAEHPNGGRDRVLRIHDADPERELGFVEESLRAAALDAPPGLRVPIEVRRLEGRVVAVHDHVAGVTLDRLLATEGPLAEERVLAIGSAVLDRLEALAASRPGAAHGRLEPAHVVLDDFDGVTLLGAGRRLSWDELPPSSEGLPEVPWLPPEFFLGRSPDPATDVWGFGALLVAMLLGRPPHAGTLHAQAWARFNAPAPDLLALRSGLRAAGLADLARDCLDPDPARRPASLADLRRRFEGAYARASSASPHAPDAPGAGPR